MLETVTPSLSRAGRCKNPWPLDSMDLIDRTLRGIAAASPGDGERGIGRHAKTILLGRAVWASGLLSEQQTSQPKEVIFAECAFQAFARCNSQC